MESYEKKYKEALEWMRDLYPTMEGMVKEDAEHYFPELKESEDERIRKEIKEFLDICLNVRPQIIEEPQYLKFTNWLEKQGEQKPEQHKYLSPKKAIDEGGAEGLSDFEKKVRDFLLDFHAEFSNGMSYSEVRNAVIGLITMFELHKPAEWSEEDERNLDWMMTVCERIHYKSDPQVAPDSALMLKDWLESLKARIAPQPKQEWSEEDEKMVERCMQLICESDYNLSDKVDLEFWLKSLRPQKQWKPTEEQMAALYEETQKSNRIKDDRIVSLYNDLKKLMEE